MEIINNKTVVVSNSSELKEALESDNGYTYIYLGSDITLESGININENKQNITINGTYMNNKYTLTGMNSIDAPDTIVANMNNNQIQKNKYIFFINIEEQARKIYYKSYTYYLLTQLIWIHR